MWVAGDDERSPLCRLCRSPSWYDILSCSWLHWPPWLQRRKKILSCWSLSRLLACYIFVRGRGLELVADSTILRKCMVHFRQCFDQARLGSLWVQRNVPNNQLNRSEQQQKQRMISLSDRRGRLCDCPLHLVYSRRLRHNHRHRPAQPGHSWLIFTRKQVIMQSRAVPLGFACSPTSQSQSGTKYYS